MNLNLERLTVRLGLTVIYFPISSGTARLLQGMFTTEKRRYNLNDQDKSKIASLAAISPTTAQIIPFLPLGKQEPFMIALTATQKISFTCLRCNKQYIGETKRRLKDRFNEHRRPVDRSTPSSRPTAVSEHFLSDNHSPNDRDRAASFLVGGLNWTKFFSGGRCLGIFIEFL